MKYIRWIFVSVLLIFFVILIIITNQLNNFDSSVYNFIIGFKANYVTFFMKFITYFASPIVLAILSLALFLKNKKIAFISLINLFGITAITQIFKFTIVRPRPEGIMLVDEIGYSFPSAHMTAAIAFYGLLIYFIWYFKINKRVLITSVTILLILFIGISRIYLGVHYATDVLGGLLLAISYLLITSFLIFRHFSSIKM